MKSLKIQKQRIYYSNFLSNEDYIDEDGNYTGEKIATYSSPNELFVSVGINSGRVSENAYGVNCELERVIISDDINCPINELSRIWIDNSIESKNDFEVVSISKTKNFISYILRKVK